MNILKAKNKKSTIHEYTMRGRLKEVVVGPLNRLIIKKGKGDKRGERKGLQSCCGTWPHDHKLYFCLE
jgi:hypothetical protein